ncbi:MAG: hypothetical protein AB7F96_09465 [Beijerinckiaceae bacterium]
MFRYSKSIYGGQEQLIGASWDLLPWFAAAGAAFVVVHLVAAALSRSRNRVRH